MAGSCFGGIGVACGIVLPSVSTNGVVVGVLIDSRDYGIRFVKRSFVNCLCRDRKSNVLSSTMSADLHLANGCLHGS